MKNYLNKSIKFFVSVCIIILSLFIFFSCSPASIKGQYKNITAGSIWNINGDKTADTPQAIFYEYNYDGNKYSTFTFATKQKCNFELNKAPGYLIDIASSHFTGVSNIRGAYTKNLYTNENTLGDFSTLGSVGPLKANAVHFKYKNINYLIVERCIHIKQNYNERT